MLILILRNLLHLHFHLPAFTVAPMNTVAVPGGTALLSCDYPGTGSEFWARGSLNITMGSNVCNCEPVLSENGSNLIFMSVNSSEADVYTCSYNIGPVTCTSEANLYVSGEPQVSVRMFIE